MVSRAVIIICLLMVPATLQAKPVRAGSTVFLTITPDTAGLSSRADIIATRSLPQDLFPLLRFALYNAGWFMNTEETAYADGPRLDITVRARFVSRPVLSHRGERRFFTRVPNYLSVELLYDWQGRERQISGKIEQTGKRDWLRLDNPNSRRVIFSPTRPEPPHFTLQRAVFQLYRELFADGNPRLPAPAGTAALHLSLFGANPGCDLIGIAEPSLLDQFGLSLRAAPTAAPPKFDSVFARIELRPPSPDYALGQRYEELGNAYPGADTITVVQYPLVHPDLEFWRPYYSRLTLVHELAHTMGAIHVSDASSIMNHGLQRTSDDRFDILNRAILNAAAAGEFDPDDAIQYVTTLSRLIQETGYRQADFPPIFSIYLSGAEKNGDRKRMEAAIGRRSFILAADAVAARERGDIDTAADLLRRAIKEDPQQAALWYYLAESTRGLESFEAMQRAALYGYFMAEMAVRK